MPYAKLNSAYDHVLCNVDDIDALKQIFGVFIIVTPEADSDGICTTNHVDDFFFWERGENLVCLSQLASIVEYRAFWATIYPLYMPPCRISYLRRRCPGR